MAPPRGVEGAQGKILVEARVTGVGEIVQTPQTTFPTFGKRQGYRPLKVGLRFSLKARMPSW